MRKASFTRKTFSVVVGITLALAVGEVAASLRDHGGFPHFNGYTSDPTLGVKLEPGFDTKIDFQGTPTSSIHINQAGFRGAEWSSNNSETIAVIGDSQVFGLGVNLDQTTPAHLQSLTRRNVLNMGVPTYGPPEYLHLVDLAAQRGVQDIVVVLNFANDVFEVDQPNVHRHVELDGWALRGEKKPRSIRFPGRRWLFQRSHLFYAARKLWHGSPESDPGVSLSPSIQPTLAAGLSGQNSGSSSESQSIGAPDSGAQPTTDLIVATEQVTEAVRDVESAERAVFEEAGVVDPSIAPRIDKSFWYSAVQRYRSGAEVGDIVTDDSLESAPPIATTADSLRQASEISSRGEQALRTWIEANPSHPLHAKRQELVDRLDQTRSRLRSINPEASLSPTSVGPFRKFLLDAKTRAEKSGGRLTVVALPLDLQIDPLAFKKYGLEPQDLSGSLSLLTDTCSDAKHLGIRCLNAAGPLRQSGAETFLAHDLHLTSRGHKALATAIASALHEKAPDASPFLWKPGTDDRFPIPTEFVLAEPVDLPPVATPNDVMTGQRANSSKALARLPKRCKGQTLRGYVHVTCRREIGIDAQGETVFALPADTTPTEVRIVNGPEDRMTWVTKEESGFIMKVGQKPIIVDFVWSHDTDRITIDTNNQMSFSVSPNRSTSK